MDSTQRTIILIKAQALREASEDWLKRWQELVDLKDETMAERYNFMATMAAGRAASLEISTYAE
jgi:hypothetical protein